MSIALFAYCFLLILCTSNSVARIIRVPDEAPTIQAGLDSLLETDTVLVSEGVYQELIYTPPIAFTMLGVQNPDTDFHALPTIDGTTLGGPDSTAVLTVPEFSFPTIKNIRVRNIRRDGIRLWADSLKVQNCTFDSTNHGIYMRIQDRGAVIQVENCDFVNNGFACLRLLTGNTLIADKCNFSGDDSEFRAIVGGGHLVLDSCYFTSNADRPLLLAVNSAQITNCTFESATTPPGTSIAELGNGKVTFANNRFLDCIYNYHALRIVTSRPDDVTVSENTFTNCIGRGSMAMGAVGILYSVSPDSMGARVSSNRFTYCSAPNVSDDLWPPVSYPTLIENNYFVHDSINGVPSIGGTGSQWQFSPITLRGNVFGSNGYALDGSAHTDAILNWWGDPSGPYQEVDNPLGQGDTITGSVQFIPWLTDTTTAIRDLRSELPSEFSLIAYPNPFNTTTRIVFTITKPGEVELTLFDVLGRNAATLLKATLPSGSHEVDAELASLASGVYFAKLEVGDRLMVTKLVFTK